MIHTFAEQAKIVEAVAPATNDGALNGDYISLKNCSHVAVVVHITQGNAANVVPALQQAKDVSGTDVEALGNSVPIFVNLDCAAGDTLSRVASDAVSYDAGATLKHKLVVFEVNPADLDEGFTSLRVTVPISNAANIVSAQYIATGMRYGEADMITD